MDKLESLSRRDLQLLAKQYGLKANAKSNELIDQIRAAEASSSVAPAAVAVSVPVVPIDFSSADANAAACAKVQEMISAMNSSIVVDSSLAAPPARSPATTASSSAAADRKRWSVRSSGVEARRSILIANSPSDNAAASAEIAAVASTSPIAVAVSTPTVPVAELVCASTSRRKWGTRPSSGARMSLLDSAILSPSPMDGTHSNAASTVTSPAAVAPISALAAEAAPAPAEDDLLSELNRRVAQRVADGDIVAIPALKSARKSTDGCKNANMPDFARAHASEARRQVSIAEHHEAKMKRAQNLTSQHHIKTPGSVKLKSQSSFSASKPVSRPSVGATESRVALFSPAVRPSVGAANTCRSDIKAARPSFGSASAAASATKVQPRPSTGTGGFVRRENSSAVKPSVTSNGNRIVNKSKLLAPTISVAGVLASVSSSSTSVAAPPAASAVSKENKLSIANRPVANAAGRPNATALAPVTAAKGGFVRKTLVKPSSVGITVEKRAPAAFGKPTPATASTSSAPTTAVVKSDAPVRNVKAPTFLSRDQKTANMVVAGRDKRDQSFEERRQKLAAVAAAAALARSNSVSAASSNMKKWEVHAAHA